MRVIRDNKELEGVKRGYEGLQGITREYKRGDRGLQLVEGGYYWLLLGEWE